MLGRAAHPLPPVHYSMPRFLAQLPLHCAIIIGSALAPLASFADMLPLPIGATLRLPHTTPASTVRATAAAAAEAAEAMPGPACGATLYTPAPLTTAPWCVLGCPGKSVCLPCPFPGLHLSGRASCGRTVMVQAWSLGSSATAATRRRLGACSWTSCAWCAFTPVPPSLSSGAPPCSKQPRTVCGTSPLLLLPCCHPRSLLCHAACCYVQPD